jgi:hypothetical protein
LSSHQTSIRAPLRSLHQPHNSERNNSVELTSSPATTPRTESPTSSQSSSFGKRSRLKYVQPSIPPADEPGDPEGVRRTSIMTNFGQCSRYGNENDGKDLN